MKDVAPPAAPRPDPWTRHPLVRRGWWLPLALSLAFGVQAAISGSDAAPPERSSRGRRVRSDVAPRGATVGPATLEGPGGAVTLPLEGGAIVHVWLEACADCMPAFEAARELGPQALPVVNVAYGSADPAWAADYGVAERLVFDRGSAVVGPQGISSFTTLVLDGAGAVRFRGRPGTPGFDEGLAQAAQAVLAGGPTPPPAPTRAPARTPRRAPSSGPSRLPRALALLCALMAGGWYVLTRGLTGISGSTLRVAGAETETNAQRCPYCLSGFTRYDQVATCAGCKTELHRACADELGRCPTVGCAEGGRPRSLA